MLVEAEYPQRCLLVRLKGSLAFLRSHLLPDSVHADSLLDLAALSLGLSQHLYEES